MGGRLLRVTLAAALAAGCAASPSRLVVPVAGSGVALDPGQRSATAQGEGVQVVVRPSAWQGSPASLPEYVTPFHLLVVNGSALPLRYDYGDLRLFDEARFQYTAMPPAEVRRLLRWGYEPGAAVVRVGGSVGVGLHWRRGPYYWDPWWWGPPYYPYYYPPPPRSDDVVIQALPVGVLQPGARSEGFVYFPRLRPDVQRLTFEFHHRLGDAPRVLTFPFAVQRAAGGGWPLAS